MTLRVPPLGRRGVVTWTVRCDSHSDPDAGIHVFACGVPTPCRADCPCLIADRYLVVEAVRAGRQWWHCADVLVCAPQTCRLAALRATSVALAQLPGCTLAVAPFLGSGCAVRTRTGAVLVSRYPAGPALLAAYAHLAGAM
jgi:hypothetical protein